MSKILRYLTVFLGGVIVALPITTWAEEHVLEIPAAAFACDGEDQELYSNWGYYLDTNTTVTLHAGVRLPNAARITSIDFLTLDSDVGTIHGYFRRTKFGFDGGNETLYSFSSPGNIGCTGGGGLCHDMTSAIDLKVDAANYNYWFYVSVPDDTGTGTDLRFYGVRFVYEVDDVIFADTFESTDTGMWDGEVSGKGLALSQDDSAEEIETEAVDRAAASEELEEFVSTLYIDDPLVQENLEKALKGVEGYASPLVIPGPAFKTKGYAAYEDYYFSENAGYVYGRPAGDGSTTMVAPLNLPDGAEISSVLLFYVDSITDFVGAPKSNIDFWLARYHLTTGDIIDMIDESSLGRDTGIRSMSVNQSQMESVETGCTTINNSVYYYWLGFSLGPYDLSPPAPYDGEDWWHKVYAVMVLYSTS